MELTLLIPDKMLRNREWWWEEKYAVIFRTYFVLIRLIVEYNAIKESIMYYYYYLYICLHCLYMNTKPNLHHTCKHGHKVKYAVMAAWSCGDNYSNYALNNWNVLINPPVLDDYFRLKTIQKLFPESLCLQVHNLLHGEPAEDNAADRSYIYNMLWFLLGCRLT